MEQLIIKQKISESLKDKKVKAVVVHTFNFDPKFFENYVMPLFVNDPSIQFRDEEIYNKITWRNCLKDNLVPPIAVFCDYYAKDNTTAPDQEYDIFCIKTPATKGAICNFHPKHLFILVEDTKNKTESLLLLTGSGNITPSGWCDNLECFSIETISKNKRHPNSVSTNMFQDFLRNVFILSGSSILPKAQELINTFLNYVDPKTKLFDSFFETFQKFLERNIPLDEVETIEIISPYFSSNDSLTLWLKSKGIKNLYSLLPTLRNNEVIITEEVLEIHQKGGLNWCLWQNKETSQQVRNLHAKIYRFYSPKSTYTIIGSVNFTNPAWGGYQEKDNHGNIESARIYYENKPPEKLLNPNSKIDYSKLVYVKKEELENSESVSQCKRNAPDILFEIDWKNKLLNITAKNIERLGCHFYQQFNQKEIKNGKSKIELSNDDLKILAKKSLIEVAVLINGNYELYSYYPNQIHSEVKPLGFTLNATSILKYWYFFDDNLSHQKFTQNLAELTTDENGFIHEEKLERKLLLNEMASHFQALVQLEKHLFFPQNLPKNEIQSHFLKIKYYLLNENVDTLSFYLEDLYKDALSNKIQNSFIWMVIQIVVINFYKKSLKWSFKHNIPNSEWNTFKKDVNQKIKDLNGIAIGFQAKVKDLSDRHDWVLKEIQKEYDY